MRAARILLLAALAVLAAPIAAAHATLVSGPSAQVPSGADTLVLSFSEALDPTFSTATLRTADGTIVPATTDAPLLSPGTLVVRTAPLPEGAYVLSWRVLSVDGHLTRGETRIASGAVAPGPAIVAPAPSPDLYEALGRALLLAGLLVVVALPIMVGVISPGLRAPGVLRATAALGAFGALTMLLAFLARLDAPLAPALASVPGTILAAQLVLALAAAALAWRAWGTASVSVFAGLALLAHVGTSHALAHVGTAGHAHMFLGIFHLGAAAVWIAGIVALVLSIRSGAPAAEGIHRFSPVAMASVAVVSVTGLAQAWLATPDPIDLLSSAYGAVLGVKTAILAALVTLGYVHQRRAPAWGSRRTSRSLRAELAVMGALLVAAGLIGATPTP